MKQTLDSAPGALCAGSPATNCIACSPPQQNHLIPQRSEHLALNAQQQNDAVNPGAVAGYMLGKMVGKGRFASVYLVKHQRTGLVAACKVLHHPPEKGMVCESSVSSKSLRREIAALDSLHHPHIIQLYQTIHTRTHTYLITELGTGGALYEYIERRGGLEECLARKLFAEVCSAVSYCHARGIVHRDLKAENVLIDRHHSALLCDFGLCAETQPGRLLRTFCGSPLYAAPEILVSRQYYGPQADVWSLGVLLYVMVVGRLPFSNTNDICIGRFTVPSSVSQPISKLLRAILRPEPSQRPSVKDILACDWLKGHLPAPTIDKNASDAQKVDEEILLLMVKKYGYSRSEILGAIGPPLANDDIGAAYRILCNRKGKALPAHERDMFECTVSVERKQLTTVQSDGNVYLHKRNPIASPYSGSQPIDLQFKQRSHTLPHLCLSDFSQAANDNTNFSASDSATNSARMDSQSSPVPNKIGTTIEKPLDTANHPCTKPRALCNLLSYSYVSKVSAAELMARLESAMARHGISWHTLRPHVIRATHGGLQWEAEVCRLPLLSAHGVRFAPVSGETDKIKAVCDVLVDALDT